MKRVILAFGTRPEATKMAPVYHALKAQSGLEPLVLLTGQHREQLVQALSLFEVPVALNLEVMTERQSLPALAARILPQTAEALEALQADYVLVHGDTLTTFAVSWASFLSQIPVGHVEAGLRSGNLAEPFPEEANRRLTDVLTDLDLAPTALAKTHLLAEGKDPDRVLVTGQTGVDAVLYAAKVGQLPAGIPQGKLVTVTLHRRENWGVLGDLAQALARVAREHPEYTFVFPVHLNPVVREAVWPVLEGLPNFVLLDPLEYGPMSALLGRSELIVTDSGGLQEEGAALGVPVVVLRNVTERPEGVEAGILRLAGTNPEGVYRMVSGLLTDEADRRRMASATNPYGDGKAAWRCAQGVAWRLGLAERPADWSGVASRP
ncbi:non-hydrolyzing UDP-N-acetylglucosamine 2-epimerase [Meiothermus granaticius]|uniref:UDP-N-acetylglucosamine 2-epimerase (non-hydrolyzing) n=1 Tax=Meiothermus granaticius NBRC 107808 TaxID=1227551 RepID=A0A399F5U0_9DEIN|nr:UDP-N-acetylglucosamine 2-epimerase (non-hydrolyzing) [Meiothermus granaticius]RIH91440.1 UDP-N-acetylglucosamine 2-epimerase [Meiothermus granaticius NBRC 107808]GEM87871.1 UDP-N-acetyl glucosamine 2-epimerase [Meiothermus granaticius NBRC 107808]